MTSLKTFKTHYDPQLSWGHCLFNGPICSLLTLELYWVVHQKSTWIFSWHPLLNVLHMFATLKIIIFSTFLFHLIHSSTHQFSKPTSLTLWVVGLSGAQSIGALTSLFLVPLCCVHANIQTLTLKQPLELWSVVEHNLIPYLSSLSNLLLLLQSMHSSASLVSIKTTLPAATCVHSFSFWRRSNSTW